MLGGGKRIRPTFAWWGWRGAGGSVDAPEALSVLRAVSALELIQACALVHDDLMDASALRRGRPTVHVAFARRHADAGWHGRPARFGAAAAILLGDLAMVWADDMFHTCGLPQETLVRAGVPWRAMRTELLGGQYLDVLHQATRDASQAAALRIDRYKTAAYTVERPLHLGAALAGAGPELVDGYRRFGADIGIAFQLRDDLLGVFGDPAVTGKPAGDDLREGKRTLLLAIALERAERRGDHAARAAIEAAVGNPGLTAEEVDRRPATSSPSSARCRPSSSGSPRSPARRSTRSPPRPSPRPPPRSWPSWPSPRPGVAVERRSRRQRAPPAGRRRTVRGATDHVVVVGAGLSGLCAALHLLGAGRRVTIVERAEHPGGRVGRLDLTTEHGTFHVDTGATVLTMPDLLDEAFAAVGEKLAERLDLVPLDPAYRAHFADGSTIDVHTDAAAMEAEIRRVCGPDSADGLPRRCGNGSAPSTAPRSTPSSAPTSTRRSPCSAPTSCGWRDSAGSGGSGRASPASCPTSGSGGSSPSSRCTRVWRPTARWARTA